MHGGADDQAAATVPILFAAFGTPRVDVLAGDTVRWMNDSVRVHTVTADDGTWASGRLPGDDSFTHHFDAVGVVDLLLHAAPVHARRGRRAQRAARRADRARRARPPLRPARPLVGAVGDRREHRGRHRGGLPAGRPRHRGRRRDVHHRDRAHDDRHLPRGGRRRGQPGRPAARARPQGRGQRRRPGPRRHRQRARRPGLEGSARRPAAAAAPALRLVAGGPREARPATRWRASRCAWRTATPRAWSSPCATAPRRWPSAARCTSGRADRRPTGRMCTFRRLPPGRRHDRP